MTREEAINILSESKRQNEVMRDNPSTFWASHQMADGVKNAERRIAALDIALTALRPDSREQVEKVWKGEWKIVEYEFFTCARCGDSYYNGAESTEQAESYLNSRNVYDFCPNCGAPMTDEAVEITMKRLEALKDGSTAD